MKVAVVCPYDLGKPGGVQDQAIRLVEWLDRSGHDGLLIGPGTQGPEDAVLLGSTLTVRANKSAVPVAIDPRIVGRLREATQDVDVIHVHEPFMPVVSVAAIRLKGKPIVGTFHADASRLTRRVMRLGSAVARTLANRLDVKTAVSPVAASVVDRLGPIRIIPNGIDLANYVPADKASDSVVFLGRDDPRKGLDVLLDAWPAIRDAHPVATLTVIGAERDEAPDGVSYRGWVTEEEKSEILGASSVYVAPNLGGESFGIVLAEGMASGCAVVASAIPAFSRVLGDAGVLVAPGDTRGVADAVARLLGDPGERATFSAAALERVARFDGATVVGQYVDAYRDAVDAHNEG